MSTDDLLTRVWPDTFDDCLCRMARPRLIPSMTATLLQVGSSNQATHSSENLRDRTHGSCSKNTSLTVPARRPSRGKKQVIHLSFHTTRPRAPMSTIHRAALLSLVLVGAAAPTPEAQQPHPLEGMWSDPPNTLEDRFCGAFCTDAGLAQLEKLLDDPANDARPYRVLAGEAQAFQNERYIRPLLTPVALKNFPLDPASDPGFLRCEPWGLARQIFAPHQLHITVRRDRIDMRYGEWDGRRTVFLDGRPRPLNQPPTPLGYSIGRFEGEALVIESDGIAANWTRYLSEHSDQLRIVERYVRDGDRLLLTATMTDPWSLKEPLVLKKVWRWAPTSEIAPYADCERPTEFRKAR